MGSFLLGKVCQTVKKQQRNSGTELFMCFGVGCSFAPHLHQRVAPTSTASPNLPRKVEQPSRTSSQMFGQMSCGCLPQVLRNGRNQKAFTQTSALFWPEQTSNPSECLILWNALYTCFVCRDVDRQNSQSTNKKSDPQKDQKFVFSTVSAWTSDSNPEVFSKSCCLKIFRLIPCF